MKKINMIETKKLISSHCVLFQCLTKMLCTLRSDFIQTEIEFFKCLYEIETMNTSEVKILISSHCVLFQSLTEISDIFILDLFHAEVE